MTRKQNTQRRPAPFRQSRAMILVVCGAENTEPDYFNGLRRHFRNPAVKVTVRSKSIDPVALVKHADKLRTENEYDTVWCVVDVDQFDVVDAVSEARKTSVNLAISDPCFEYWLLLHFEDCRTPMTDYVQVERRLKKHLPHYDKRHIMFADYAETVGSAVGRGRKRCPGNSFSVEHNPSSTVWRLVEAVL